MGRFVDRDILLAELGEEELLQVAGAGDWNSAEGRAIDDAALVPAIRYADSLIAGYVTGRHPWVVEIADPRTMPDPLPGLAVDIVRYRLRNRSGAAGQITETVEKRYNAALVMLRDLSSGKMDLVDPRSATPHAVSPQTDGPRIAGGPPTAGPLADEFLQ